MKRHRKSSEISRNLENVRKRGQETHNKAYQLDGVWSDISGVSKRSYGRQTVEMRAHRLATVATLPAFRRRADYLVPYCGHSSLQNCSTDRNVHCTFG